MRPCLGLQDDVQVQQFARSAWGFACMPWHYFQSDPSQRVPLSPSDLLNV